MGCGVVLDYRGPDEVLRAHTELWLTPLSGVRPADHGGNWAATLHAAHAVLEVAYPTAQGEAYESTATSLALAAQMAEDLDVEGADEERVKAAVLVGVAMAETMATAADGQPTC